MDAQIIINVVIIKANVLGAGGPLKLFCDQRGLAARCCGALGVRLLHLGRAAQCRLSGEPDMLLVVWPFCL